MEINPQKFKNNVIQEIKEKNLKPLPGWFFVLKNILLWILGILAVLAGGLTLAGASFIKPFAVWQEASSMETSPIFFLINSLPLIWVLAMIAFTLLAYSHIKKTENGYRFSPLLILILIVVATLTTGGVMQAAGIDEKVDDVLSHNLPQYETIINPNVRFWSDPQAGRLWGKAISPEENGYQKFLDAKQKVWKVKADNSDRPLPVGETIKLKGEKKNNDTFHYKTSAPGGAGKGFLDRPHHDQAQGRGQGRGQHNQ